MVHIYDRDFRHNDCVLDHCFSKNIPIFPRSKQPEDPQETDENFHHCLLQLNGFSPDCSLRFSDSLDYPKRVQSVSFDCQGKCIS